MDRTISTQSEEAWERTVVAAYEQHARILWEYGRRLGRDRDGAEDTVHEAFARLMHLPAPRRPDNIGGWRYRTVHNLVVDEHRRGRRIVAASVSPLQERRGAEDPDAAERIALWEAVDRLPPRQREVIFPALSGRARLRGDRVDPGHRRVGCSGERVPCDAVAQEDG